MKTLKKIFLIITMLTFSCAMIQAQEINFDKFKIGNTYKVLIENGWSTEGILVKKDLNTIDIKSEIKTYTINKNEIKQIVNSNSDFEPVEFYTEQQYIPPTKQKTFGSIGIGLNIPSNEYSESYTSGINIQLGITRTMTDIFSLRGSMQFAQSVRKTESENYGFGYTYVYDGGNINLYNFTADFLFGNFSTKSKVTGYGFLSTGFSTSSLTDFTLSIPETGYSDTYENKESLEQITLGFGGGMSYMLSKKFSVFGEGEYAFPLIYLEKGADFNVSESFNYGNFFLKIGLNMNF